MVPDVVGRFTMRDLPQDLAPVEIDGADLSVRRLHDRQSPDVEVGAAAAFSAGRARASASRPAR